VVDYLSLFNEPEEVYTKIKYPEIKMLLRDHVGPALKQSGLTTKLMMSEAPERKVAYERYPVVLDDPAARKFVSVVAYHGYDFKNFDKIAKLEKRYPDLPFWMDELCYAYEAGYPKNKKLPIYEFDDGDVWGNIIFMGHCFYRKGFMRISFAVRDLPSLKIVRQPGFGPVIYLRF